MTSLVIALFPLLTGGSCLGLQPGGRVHVSAVCS